MNIEHLAHALDREKHECKVIIETPRGRRNKFKYDPEAELFTLSRVLPEGFTFPFDFGFVPSTLAEDGDALDVLVLMDEPAHVGCILPVRIIGAIRTKQTEKGQTIRNDRLVAVALRSLQYEEVRSMSDLRGSFVDQVSDFLALYNKDSEKKDEVEGTVGPDEAVKLLEEADAAWRRENS
jgi:inorganic pyrophosphatase